MNSINENPLPLIGFDHSNILDYIKKLSSNTVISTPFIEEQQKGLLMFKEKFVAGICFIEDSGNFHIQGKVKAEMKKSVTYVVTVLISSSNEILECSCACPAGQKPASCKHSFSLLYCLEDYSRKEMFLAPTEKLQQWHKPNVQRFSPHKCKEVFRSAPQPYKPPTSCDVDYSALMCGNMSIQVFSVLSNSQDMFQKCSMPLPACVVSTNMEKELWSAAFPDEMDSNHSMFVLTNLQVNLESIWMLEQTTTSQSKSDVWRNERLKRLTSSLFFKICHWTGDEATLANDIFHSHFKDLSHIPAVKYGQEMESFVRSMIRQKYSDFVVRKVGFVTTPLMPFLGASPDGLIHNDNNSMCLEIKCVYNPKNQSLDELAKRSNFCLAKNDSGDWVLKQNHQYYYQIQGQLALTNLDECVFALYYKRPNFVHIESIKFDKHFWESIKKELYLFYTKFYLPLIYGRI